MLNDTFALFVAKVSMTPLTLKDTPEHTQESDPINAICVKNLLPKDVL